MSFYDFSIEPLAQLHSGCNYSWCAMEVGLDSEARVVMRYGGGCSCDSISNCEWEDVTSWDAIVNAIHSQNQTSENYSPADITEFLWKVHKIMELTK